MMVLHEHFHIISLQNLIHFVLYSFYEECIIVYKVLLHIYVITVYSEFGFLLGPAQINLFVAYLHEWCPYFFFEGRFPSFCFKNKWTF